MSRALFVGGNWKSNGSRALIDETINRLKTLEIPSNVQVLIAPSYIHLPYFQSVNQSVNQSKLIVSSQNISPFGPGAYTGEINADQLIEQSINWTLIGHSERRQLFGATDEVIERQINQSINRSINMVLCCGETDEQRKANQTMTVIEKQLQSFKNGIESINQSTNQSTNQSIDDLWSTVVIAYEPVWAIGTGNTATAQQAEEVHAAIREWIKKSINQSISQSVRIIYGGSVTEKNANELINQPNIDGFLVGGASLKPEFNQIIQAAIDHSRK